MHANDDATALKKWIVYRKLSQPNTKFCNMTFCKDGIVAYACSDGTIKKWNADENDNLHTKIGNTYSDTLLPLAYNPSNDTIVTANTGENLLKILPLDPTTGTQYLSPQDPANKLGLAEIIISNDGQKLITRGFRGYSLERATKLWDTQTRELAHQIDEDSFPRKWAFNHDGTKIASVPGLDKNFCDVFSTKNMTTIQRLENTYLKLDSVAASPNNPDDFFATCADGSVVRWDTVENKVQQLFKLPNATLCDLKEITISLTGEYIAISRRFFNNSYGVEIYQVNNNAKNQTAQVVYLNPELIKNIAFDRTGDFLGIVSGNEIVILAPEDEIAQCEKE